jgi:hypothetical protein
LLAVFTTSSLHSTAGPVLLTRMVRPMVS